MMLPRKGLLLALCLTAVAGQQHDYPEYQDYAGDYGADDNLYRDYATRQQEKEVGGGG